MTVEDIKKSLTPAPGKILLFRPTCGAGFIEVDNTLLNQAFDEIAAKIPMVQAGLIEFTECEKLLFMLFMEHARYGR